MDHKRLYSNANNAALLILKINKPLILIKIQSTSKVIPLLSSLRPICRSYLFVLAKATSTSRSTSAKQATVLVPVPEQTEQ